MKFTVRVVALFALAAGALTPAVAASAGVASAAVARGAAGGEGTQPLVAGDGMPASTPPGGARLWLQRFTGGADRSGFGASLAVSPDRSVVYVTGATTRTSGARAEDYATVAYNAATGAMIWEARYQGTVIHPGPVPSIAVSPNGSMVFVAGELGGRRACCNAVILAYNAATGAAAWTAATGPVIQHIAAAPHAVAVSPDSSTVYIAGHSKHAYLAAAFDAATGTVLWTASSPGTKPRAQHDAKGIVVSSDGSDVLVTGEIGTVAFDAQTGAQLWAASFLGTLAVSPGSPAVFVTYKNKTTARVAATGAELWHAHYRGPPGTSTRLTALAVSPDGSRVFVTGSTQVGPCCGEPMHFTTIGYDAATGARLWVAGFRGPGDASGRPAAIAVSPDGAQVFITGTTNSPSGPPEFTTIGYDAAAGAQLWGARVQDLPGASDVPSSVAVSHDGSKVLVAGDSNAGSGNEGYLTVAYRA
jgi:DNA-binding beta-propeller fold protein YncE